MKDQKSEKTLNAYRYVKKIDKRWSISLNNNILFLLLRHQKNKCLIKT